MNTGRNRALSVVFLILSLFLWEGIVRLLAIPAFILPPPTAIAMAMYRGLVLNFVSCEIGPLELNLPIYLCHMETTLTETFLGFLFGTLLAFILGTAIALNRYVDYFLYPYVVMFQSMPKVALAPLIVVWFGLGLTSKVVNAALVAFFPLLVNTIVGLRSADPDRVSLMRSLGANPGQIFWMLRLPSAMPFVMAGLEIAMIFALIGAIVAEFIGAEKGLGMLIQSMNFTMDVAGQFSVLLILSLLGLLLNGIVVLIRRRALFWDASEKAAAELSAGKVEAV